jgi:hypothetical protein
MRNSNALSVSIVYKENKSFMKLGVALVIVCIIGLSSSVHAQMQATSFDGEIGLSIGPSHYFGDLNTRSKFNTLNMAGGIFYRKNFGEYIAGRASLNFAKMGYSDKYNTDNYFQRTRNLNFQTGIYEFTVQGDFNFFKYKPGFEGFRFTPYVTLGVGVFGYAPFTYLNGQKQYLRPLATEGQGQPDRPKKYGSIAVNMPIGVGFKYAINQKINLGLEISHRFTTTDYLDDVSTTYAGAAAFANPTALALQDRSYEQTATPIGIVNRQRGFSKQKDQYIFVQFMLSFNLTSYRCPSVY